MRVSTFDQTTVKYHKDDDKEIGVIGIEEYISGYKVKAQLPEFRVRTHLQEQLI